MRKVLVIGPGGAGKSTFASRLGEILSIEVIHLDSLYWRAGWIETPKEEWRQTVERLVNSPAWVMDGNYSGTLEIRFKACDTVVFLDIGRAICLWRVIKRVLKSRNRSRPDMAAGCPERLDFKFLLWIWSYPKRTRPKVMRMLEDPEHKRIVWLRSDSEIERFLASSRTANEYGESALNVVGT